MKIRLLREIVTGADKPLNEKYNYEVGPGSTFIDDNVCFDEGWVVFEEPGNDDNPYRYYYTVKGYMDAIDDESVAGHIDDELREKLEPIKGKYLTISVLMKYFPDEYEMGYKLCHLLYFRNDPEDYFSNDVEYYFHNVAKDAYTKRADRVVSMNRRKKK